MTSTALFLFALVALAVIATPGPTVLLALVNGSHYGVRRSVPGMARGAVGLCELYCRANSSWFHSCLRPS